MNIRRYKGYSLRKKFLLLTIFTVLLSFLFTATLSFFTIRRAAREINETNLQKKSAEVIAALDYAVSDKNVRTENIPDVLQAKLMEIADIHKLDIIIYDLQGRYLISNKDENLVLQKNLSPGILQKLLQNEQQIDIQEPLPQDDGYKTSSYLLLKNNTLDTIGIVYLPFYYSNDAYHAFMSKFVQQLLTGVFVLILLIAVAAYGVSKSLSTAIHQFSEQISNITLFNENPEPIKYYADDELGALVKVYNRLLLQLSDQKERLGYMQKNEAWRSMATQVAHQVNTPLTPMKLRLQAFQMRFDPQDPNIRTKVEKLTTEMIGYIDEVSSVARTFASYAKLRQPENTTFDIVAEIREQMEVFNDAPIFVHSNPGMIAVLMDKDFLERIVTNLINNAIDAISTQDNGLINVDIEKRGRQVVLTVADNGVGIEKENAEKIFEPNFSSKNSGMGIGLTIVKSIVSEYKGQISLNSSPAAGAAFTVTLPIIAE